MENSPRLKLLKLHTSGSLSLWERVGVRGNQMNNTKERSATYAIAVSVED